MLKKMQRRFILAAMAAFGAVLLILLVGINVANYFQATSMQDWGMKKGLQAGRRHRFRPVFLLSTVTRRGTSGSSPGTIFLLRKRRRQS